MEAFDYNCDKFKLIQSIYYDNGEVYAFPNKVFG